METGGHSVYYDIGQMVFSRGNVVLLYRLYVCMYCVYVCMYVLYCTIHFAPVGKNGICRLLEGKL